MSADFVYDNYMMSVFTREAARNVYKQFQADLPDWCGCWSDINYVCILSSVYYVCILYSVYLGLLYSVVSASAFGK